MSKNMLIVSCTQEQKKYVDPQKAILVFDDDIFKMLREELKDSSKKEKINIIVLSSKFNVIPTTINIKPYEKKMTKEVAEKTIDFNTYLVKKYISMYKPENIVACLEEPYELAVNWEDLNRPVKFLANNNRREEIKKWIDTI